MNYKLKIDYAKLKRVGVAHIQGKTGKVKCVVIPVDENNIFLSEKGGIYQDFNAFEMKKESYGQSHILKPAIPKEEFDRMSDDEKNAVSIVGSLSPLKARQAEVTEEAQADPEDDLPF